MAEQTKGVNERVGAVTQGRGYAFGQLLSRVFHPVSVPIVTLFLVGLYSGPTLLRGLGWAVFCTLMQVVPIAVFFAWRIRRGAYSDNDVSVRHQRTELYIVGVLSMAVGIGLLLVLGAPLAFVKTNAAGLIVTVLCFMINMFWKISVHSGTLASCATILSFFSTTLGAIFWACTLLVGWARVRTGNHTPAQVLAGFVVAAVCVLLVFRFPL